MSEAQAIVDDLEAVVSRTDLDSSLKELEERLTTRLTATWRRDLLLIITGQFVALAGVLTAVA
ncbi:MAG: hypothetical protein KY461_08625 [Actinobacteria bacterium]|nr:hypothetical protein [Actinomycetota bacterium]